jgi:S1-C subfamily serine protease
MKSRAWHRSCDSVGTCLTGSTLAPNVASSFALAIACLQRRRTRQPSLTASVVSARRRRGRVVKLGSGVVIGAERVATACHVTRHASTIEIALGSERWVAQSQVGSLDHDLCILTVPAAELRKPEHAAQTTCDRAARDRRRVQDGSRGLSSAEALWQRYISTTMDR